MLTPEDIFMEMKTILQDKLQIAIEKPLTLEHYLTDDIGLDSIMLLELLVELELKYEIEIDINELDASIREIGCLVNFVLEKVRLKETSETRTT